MAKRSTTDSAKPAELETSVRRALNRIITSKSFRQVDRLQRFLTYIVEETLAGRGDQLKEYPVGVDVFSKDSSFDPRMDPIVRVQARRLRMRLASYYELEGKADDLVIEMPKGGYAPSFRREESAQPKKATATALVSRNSVAVMPFTDDSPSSDQAYFCNGLAHEILRSLSEVQSLVVTTGAVPGQESSPPAAMVISGSVRKSHDVLRITTHISDSIRGCYVWTGSVDRTLGDPFVIQEEVARMIVDTLRTDLLDVSNGSGLKPGAANVAANNLYVQGRYHLNQRTEKGLLKAIDFFSDAIREDPKSAAAYAGLADAHNLSAHYGVCSPADVWTKAAFNATHAVLIDDDSSEAHTSLAHILATQDWDWSTAEQEFRRAITLNPRNATAHHWYAVACLAPLGRLVEAMEEIKLAHALDPLSSIIARDIALLYYYYQRNYDLALEQCDRTIEQNPHFAAVYWTLGLVQEQRGEGEEAAAAFQRAIELSPPSPRILGALGGALAKEGKRDQACEILRELHELSLKRYISPFELALIHFNLGKENEGFELLKRAFEDRCVELVNIHLDPRFDSVRSDARFKALFRKLHLSSEAA